MMDTLKDFITFEPKLVHSLRYLRRLWIKGEPATVFSALNLTCPLWGSHHNSVTAGRVERKFCITTPQSHIGARSSSLIPTSP